MNTLPEHSSFKTSDGVELAWLESGSGPTLLMLPGWSQSAAMFLSSSQDFLIDSTASLSTIADTVRANGLTMATESVASPAMFESSSSFVDYATSPCWGIRWERR